MTVRHKQNKATSASTHDASCAETGETDISATLVSQRSREIGCHNMSNQASAKRRHTKPYGTTRRNLAIDVQCASATWAYACWLQMTVSQTNHRWIIDSVKLHESSARIRLLKTFITYSILPAATIAAISPEPCQKHIEPVSTICTRPREGGGALRCAAQAWSAGTNSHSW